MSKHRKTRFAHYIVSYYSKAPIFLQDRSREFDIMTNPRGVGDVFYF